MKLPAVSRVLGVVLVVVAVAICLLLGTLGWFVIGFGILTDCTNDYSCGTTGCAPCRSAGWWINGGGIAQLGLAGLGVVGLVLALRAGWGGRMVLAAAGLTAVSALTVVGTTWAAQESYCRPGSEGYEASYCSVRL